MQRTLLALLMLAAAFGPARADAQIVQARLDAWLCNFFADPQPEKLAQFPAYGLGPLATSTKASTTSDGRPKTSTIHTLKSDSVTITLRWQTQTSRSGRPEDYGFELKVESKGAPIWADRATATAALSRVGRTRYDRELDDVVAEDGLEEGGQFYFWTASFDVHFQRLQIEWLHERDAAYGRGFCQG